MNNGWTSEIARLQAEIHALQEQNEKLEAWIDDLQSGMYINCVYCGYRYGPNTVSHVTMRKALEDHIASCPKHPLSTAKSALEQARRELDEARGFEKDESRRRQKMHAALVRVASSLNYFYAVRIAKNALEEDK